MSGHSNLPDDSETPVPAYRDPKGWIIGILVGVVILGAIAALVGHRDVAKVDPTGENRSRD